MPALVLNLTCAQTTVKTLRKHFNVLKTRTQKRWCNR